MKLVHCLLFDKLVRLSMPGTPDADAACHVSVTSITSEPSLLLSPVEGPDWQAGALELVRCFEKCFAVH
jgi:hypothetical protein